MNKNHLVAASVAFTLAIAAGLVLRNKSTSTAKEYETGRAGIAYSFTVADINQPNHFTRIVVRNPKDANSFYMAPVADQEGQINHPQKLLCANLQQDSAVIKMADELDKKFQLRGGRLRSLTEAHAIMTAGSVVCGLKPQSTVKKPSHPLTVNGQNLPEIRYSKQRGALGAAIVF